MCTVPPPQRQHAMLQHATTNKNTKHMMAKPPKASPYQGTDNGLHHGGNFRTAIDVPARPLSTKPPSHHEEQGRWRTTATMTEPLPRWESLEDYCEKCRWPTAAAMRARTTKPADALRRRQESSAIYSEECQQLTPTMAYITMTRPPSCPTTEALGRLSRGMPPAMTYVHDDDKTAVALGRELSCWPTTARNVDS